MPEPQTDETPWLARHDWASGRVTSSQIAGLVLPWIMTAGFCGVTSAYLAGYGLFQHPGKVLEDRSLLVLAPFVLVSVALLLWSLRRTFLAITSGTSTLELTTIPGVIGGEFNGLIHLSRQLRDGQSIRLSLSCNVVSWTRSFGKSSGSSYTAWQDDREVGASEIIQSGTVRVSFAIPNTAEATARHEGDRSGWHTVSWELEALGAPGEFWRGAYEVPVFRTSDSPPPEAPAQSDFAAAGAMLATKLHGKAFDEDGRPDLVARPPSTRISTKRTARGLEVELPIRTTFFVATLWVVATLPLYVAPLLAERWLPALAASITFSGSLVAALFLNLIPAFLLVIGEPRRFVVGPSEIVVACGWSLFGLQRRFPMDQFDGVDASMENFSVLRKNASFLKRRFFLATKLESNAEARWLASQIDQAVRRP